MKRFILFSGENMCTNGGAGDFVGHYDTIEDAVAVGKKIMKLDPLDFEWWHVFDTETLTCVAAHPGTYCGGMKSGEKAAFVKVDPSDL